MTKIRRILTTIGLGTIIGLAVLSTTISVSITPNLANAAATKAVPNATVDLMLNDIATGTMVVYTSMTTNPANAAAITGVLATRTLTPGNGNDFIVTSGTSVQVKAATTTITATATGTATCIIIKTGTSSTDGVIKLITTGSTAITSGQQYTPAAFTYTYNQPT